ncbi:3266_t:CDS:1 [Ambispora gerdemannii]|uniref:3266_t:CDS:1 n=1 Tax=Ambispora gerdemannii TaxID=144530 RepID=A0A9N8VE86_9GLOM|nr:3266_t:CDS:1 [Ambispora gerdemannii]
MATLSRITNGLFQDFRASESITAATTTSTPSPIFTSSPDEEIIPNLLLVFHQKLDRGFFFEDIATDIRTIIHGNNITLELAFNLLIIKANDSEKPAKWLCLIGFFYLFGIGVELNVELNYKIAFTIFNNAVEGDEDGYAQLFIGYCYQFGFGIVKNSTRQESWLKKSAASRNPRGQQNLAQFYFDSNRSKQEKHYWPAFYWFREAALAGNESSQQILAEYFEVGDACNKDIFTAIKLNRRCIKRTDLVGLFATHNLSRIFSS